MISKNIFINSDQYKAFRFIILLGLVSLLSDTVFEGARSIIGPFLGTLGASGAVIGFVFGFGELISNLLRIVSGYLVDKTSRYWLLTFLGYFCNLISIPLLAFVHSWEAAAGLIMIERIGKAIRTPSRDTMLSYATKDMGRGSGFGLHQVLDQMGGMLGPGIIAIILFSENNYRLGFLILAIPALLSLIMLGFSSRLYPYPQEFETATIESSSTKMPRKFWIYLFGTTLLAAGYADFPLIAFHLQQSSILSPIWIPIYYIIAMSASAASALLFGWIYDRYGSSILIIAILLSTFFAPFVFLGHALSVFIGMIIWGIGIGSQRSLLKAVVGDMITKAMRGRAYGIFNTAYGIAWFIGSWIIGILYDHTITWLIVFSMTAQLCAVPFIYYAQKKT